MSNNLFGNVASFLGGFSQPTNSQEPQQMDMTPTVAPELIAKFRREMERMLPHHGSVMSDAAIKEALGIHGEDTNGAINFLLEKAEKLDPGAGKNTQHSDIPQRLFAHSL
jgi:hypothetical protein